MSDSVKNSWERKILLPDKALTKIEPGMRLFLGSGAAEPRTLVRHMMASKRGNLHDLELIQLVSFGEAVKPTSFDTLKYRLKTFSSGWMAGEAVSEGRADLIPCRFSRIPERIQSGQIPIDAALVQISPPDETGRCSLGMAVDAAAESMARSSLTVGEINTKIPVTLGETTVQVSDFTWIVHAADEPFYLDRWPVSDLYDQLAAQVASVIEDGCCISYSFGPLFDALGRHLSNRRDLGIHSPFFTDALMDLVKSGAVTNRMKQIFPEQSVASYAIGTPELMAWLDRNPQVALHGIDQIFNPIQIGCNPRVVSIHVAHRVDLSGRIALPAGRGLVAAGPEEAVDFINGAELSQGGLAIIALTSRDPGGRPNIRVSLGNRPSLFSGRESVDIVATEYGIANLSCKTLRERAQALIDIAHPDDRRNLVEQAKTDRVLYADQVFLAECAVVDPLALTEKVTFKKGIAVRFRAIRPSDEEEMRRLFYRFSDESVYYRYFSPIHSMPHEKMQTYVNADCDVTLSIVGVAGVGGQERIIAEARFVGDLLKPEAEVAFVVDDDYHGLGIATYLFKKLVTLARQRGIQALTADVLATNRAMMMVFERGGIPIEAKLMDGVYVLTMRLDEDD